MGFKGFWKLPIGALLLFLLPAYAVAEIPMLFSHNGPETSGDVRYRYHWRVLRAALDATVEKWGSFQMRPASYMNEARQILEMQAPAGQINTMVLDSTDDLEKTLVPVKIPVDKGLIGYRVFLIRQTDQERFKKVRTMADLKQFRIGQGAGWSDVAILRKAGLQVITGQSYRGLFSMLGLGRFDAFGRGVTEVRGELSEFGPETPGLAIESELLLYYPMPVYFWFPNTPDGHRRAERVEQGMRILIANGTLDSMFRAEYQETLDHLALRKRRLFVLDNPVLPPNQPFADKALWYDPRNR